MDNEIQQHQIEEDGPCRGCPGTECEYPFPNVGTSDTNAVIVSAEPPFYADDGADVSGWDMRVGDSPMTKILREIELAMVQQPGTAMYVPMVRCDGGSYEDRVDNCLTYAIGSIGEASPDLVVLYGQRARSTFAPIFDVDHERGGFVAEETRTGRGVVQCPVLTDNADLGEYMDELRRGVESIYVE